ncbi:transposase [Streptomyces sp. NPDC048411]|uniref:transposase n=1 Tax=Streptomyces sp. NPDC048411 TaxID=3157206 RepID=UPI003451DFB5
MTTIKEQVTVEAAIAQQAWTAALGAAMGEIADCFPRREPLLVAREMTQAMLMELDTRNCWTLAEAFDHYGPHRLQHFLSRSGFDHDVARDRLAAWTAGELADENVVLIVNEAGDARHTYLVVRRHRYTGELSFYRCYSAPSVTLATLIDVITRRWKIEDEFQLAKGACGDWDG